MTAAAGEHGDWLWRESTLRNFLIAFVLFLAFSAAFELWASHVGLLKPSRIGVQGRLSAGAVEARLEGLTPAWRRYYLLSTLTLDLLFPVVYTLMFSFAIGALLRAADAPAALHVLRFVPFLAAVADYAENAFILLFVTGRRPASEAARALAVLTPAKWWLIYASAGIVALLGVWALARPRPRPG